MPSTESTKLMTIIGLILVIMGVVLLGVNNSDRIASMRTQVENFTEQVQEAVTSDKKEPKKEKKEQSQTVKNLSGDLNTALSYYTKFKQYMESLEHRVQEFNNPLLVVIALLALFALKSFVSIVPVNATCILTGFILPFWAALLMNFAGLAIIFTIKYFWGKSRPKNSIHRIVKRIPTIEKLVEGDSFGANHGNPVLLFALRLVPSIPVNTISQLYGYMEFNYLRFLILSLLGIALKIVTYTCIGANVSNPLSSAFMLPVAIVFLVSGLVTIGVAAFIRNRRKQELINKKAKALQKQFGMGLKLNETEEEL